MTLPSRTGRQFEDEVRNIARSLFSNGLGQGSEIIQGRERDGVFWNGQFYTVVEATTEKTKDKAELDGKKTHDLVTEYRQKGYMAQGFLVMLHEPTPDQKDIIKKKRFDRTTRIISFDEFRSLLFDSLMYINNREKKRFGSVYDYVNNKYEVPVDEFVETTIQMQNSPIEDDRSGVEILVDGIQNGNKYVLVAEYGVGKSMVLRQVFYELARHYRAKKHFRTPIAINLREHLGQIDPIELLERHARANASSPQNLVAAWNAGYVDLLIDGFDELSTRGWTGNVKKLREYRRASHNVVRKLIQDTPAGCGVIIAGRDAYFDSINEMRESLGAPEAKFELCRVHPFDEAQAIEFLLKKGFSSHLPDWIPTRPLLLTYLVTKGLLNAAVGADTGSDFPRGRAWLSLIDMIALRESEQSEGIDKDSLVAFLGALAVHARHSAGGVVSFTPQQMEEIFTIVTGTTIMEDERNILLRLPGLGAAQDNVLNRSFIDDDLMNACCARPVYSYTQNPYLDYTKLYGFESLASPLNEVGIEALARLFSAGSIASGVIGAAIDRAISNNSPQLSYDIFMASTRVVDIVGNITFEGVDVSEVDLTESDFDGKKVLFLGCLIGRVILPIKEETNEGVTFSDCLIGSIEGRVSEADLGTDQFIDCEIGEYTDEYSVNDEVLDSSLPLGVRVLVVTLRKLFSQRGSGRLESALYRGLDHRSKMLVPEVLEALIRNNFIVATGRRGKVTYSGTKAKRNEALKIIQSPNGGDFDIIKECISMS